jgi:1-acyl-sn-glycerol-3-phosphate acyltransferase
MDVVLPASVPSTRSALARWLGRSTMRLTKWRFAGALPDLKKFVIIVAPHTSNWDFPVGLQAKFALGLEAVWIGKHTLFRWPVGGLLRALGGLPVHRDAAHAVVQRIVDEFAARERMVFALAPEGTRKRVEKWRSGYWHIAHQAGVPIVPVGFDYASREVRIGTPLVTTESIERDERALRVFCASIRARKPELYA